MYGKFTCLDCEETFEEPEEVTEHHGFSEPPYETSACCPFCGGDFVRTLLCDGCGRPITGAFVRTQPFSQVFCEACFSVHDITDLTY